jgi:hypothetical protein
LFYIIPQNESAKVRLFSQPCKFFTNIFQIILLIDLNRVLLGRYMDLTYRF